MSFFGCVILCKDIILRVQRHHFGGLRSNFEGILGELEKIRRELIPIFHQFKGIFFPGKKFPRIKIPGDCFFFVKPIGRNLRNLFPHLEKFQEYLTRGKNFLGKKFLGNFFLRNFYPSQFFPGIKNVSINYLGNIFPNNGEFFPTLFSFSGIIFL